MNDGKASYLGVAAMSLALTVLAAACKNGSNENGDGCSPACGDNEMCVGTTCQCIAGAVRDETGRCVVPVCSQCGDPSQYYYRLPSPSEAVLWTAPNIEKVLPGQAVPETEAEFIGVHAARGEFEPFQLVIRPGSGLDVSLQWEGPAGAVVERAELYRVDFVNVDTPSDPSGMSGRVPDPLEPLVWGEGVTLDGGENRSFWVSLKIDPAAAAGDHDATLRVATGSTTTGVAVRIHVFDVDLAPAISFKSQMNYSHQELGGSEGLDRVEEIKNFFFERRLTPKSVAWPAGLNYNGGIEYDCAGTIDDEDGEWGFAVLGPKYVDGVGWNSVGFPSFMAFQFTNNSTPRPDEFCGVSRGDHYGSAAYNEAWSLMLSTVDRYVVDHGYAQKAYYYVMNEPQNQEDYDLAAYLAELTRAAAPNLRIAVSEEPKPEIAEHPSYDGAFDIWFANLSHYDRDYAWQRQQTAGEEVWWYFLYGDGPPLPNPTTIDHAGIESRIIVWLAWIYRVDGFAYYSLTGWGDDPWNDPRPQGTNQNGDGFMLYPPLEDGRLRPSIRLELLREAFEDYEYFVLANGGKPAAGETVAVDTTVGSAAGSLTGWLKDPAAFMEVRKQLGRYIAGEIDQLPVVDTGPSARPRGAYFINFQDPAGEPSADPLVVDGNEYMKIGWNPYDSGLAYGWYGENLGTDRVLYTYLADAPVDDRQKSIIYDDWGRENTFEFDIENGLYEVTLSVGWNGRTYSHHRVVIEGTAFVDDEATTPESPYIVRTHQVDVTDGKLTMETGIFDEYTMLNYLDIVPAG